MTVGPAESESPAYHGTPLVGRDAELAWLDRAVRRVGEGCGLKVLDLTGEAGIGKSRLITEVCLSARRRGLTLLRGRATEYERHVPFLPFTDAFADLRQADLDEIPDAGGLAPVLHGRPLDGVDRFGVHRATSALLARLGGRGPVLLVLDDLHWADPASVDLLDYLIRHPVPAPVLIVVARRPRQSPVPLAAGLARGGESGTVIAHALGPLAADACAEHLGAGVPPKEFEALYTASEGNPLYLLALLQARPASAADPTSPPRLLDALLLDELVPLSDRQRRTVETVAVLGGHATTDMIAAADGRMEDEVLDDLRLLLAKDLVRIDGAGRLALRHPVLRSLVRSQIEPWRQAAMHRTVADRLARVDASAAEQAHHVEHALTTAWDRRAAEVLVKAAGQSAGTAPESSAHWLEVALRYMPRTSEYATWRRALILQRAHALAVCGRLRESRALLHEVIALSADDEATSTRIVAVALCSGVERHLGQYPEAMALLRREMARRPEPNLAEVIALTLALGSVAVQDGSYRQVRNEMDHALSLARTLGDEASEAGLLAVAALGEVVDGETTLALEHVRHAVALLDALPDDGGADLCEPLTRLAYAEVQLERFAEADRHADRGLALARRTGRTSVLPYLLLCKAQVGSHTGHLAHALGQVEEAEEIARGFGSEELLVLTLGIKTQVLTVVCPAGDPRPMAAADEAVARAGLRGNWLATNAWGMMGLAALLAGDPRRAREAVLRAGGPDLAGVQVSKRPMFLEVLVDACLTLGKREEALAWAERARTDAEALDLPGQRAAALRCAASARWMAGDQGAAELYLEAAAESERSGLGFWAAYSLLLAARAMAGRPALAPKAEAAWHRGSELAEASGAGALVSLAEAVRAELASGAVRHVPRLEALAALTPREREVANLVSQGLTSVQIADRLFLSRRTIESHLSRVYRKTGVTTRIALAVLVAGHG
ncbi:DNA-binding CsgD family transcriptional regulator [Catenulispora sp. GP43]